MYRCKGCGRSFTQPASHGRYLCEDKSRPKHVTGHKATPCCPECGSENIEGKFGKRYSDKDLHLSVDGKPWMAGPLAGLYFRAVKVKKWKGKQ